MFQNLVNLANDGGGVEEKAGWGDVGPRTHEDLGVVGTWDDPDVGLHKPVPPDQYRVFVAQRLAMEVRGYEWLDRVVRSELVSEHRTHFFNGDAGTRNDDGGHHWSYFL